MPVHHPLLPMVLLAAACGSDGNADDSGAGTGDFDLALGMYVNSDVSLLDDGCLMEERMHIDELDGSTMECTHVDQENVIFNGDTPGEMKFVRDGNTLTWEREEHIDRTKEGIDCVMDTTGRYDDTIVADDTIEWVNTISAEGTGTECDMPIPCTTRVSGRLALLEE